MRNAVTHLVALSIGLATPGATAQDLIAPPAVLEGRSDTLLHAILLAEADGQFHARADTLARALAAGADLHSRLEERRSRYRQLLGPFPERTPLHAAVTGTEHRDGYRIEKVVFESRPNHHVTANLYVPTGAGAPWPAVLLTCGHADVGKASEAYQQAAILLARNGFVVLVIDPIGQGERYQLLDDAGRPTTSGGTVEHSLLFVGSALVGTSIVGYEAWDNIRGIDYLVSRPEVNPTRIGVTGNSGGGTQTTFLASLDDRIDVAAPSCFVMQRETLFKTIGPQDGCQHLPGEGWLGLDHADYLALFAPRPVLMLAAERDYFDIGAVRRAFEELGSVYTRLEIPDRAGFFAFDDTHGFSRPRREAMVGWMRRWLHGDATPVVETESHPLDEPSLRVTPTGQVGAHFADEVFVQDLNLRSAHDLARSRETFLATHNRGEIRQKIRSLLGMRADGTRWALRIIDTLRTGPVEAVRLVFERVGDVPLPAHLYLPRIDGGRPLTVVVDGRGKETEGGADGLIARELSLGRAVLAVDLGGFGETTDDPERNRYVGDTQREYRTAMIALHSGRPLLGRRVEQLLGVLDRASTFRDIEAPDVRLIGLERAGAVALHAAALDDRVNETVVRSPVRSWIELLEHPERPDQLGWVVPGALQWYDWPDLVRLAQPGRVSFVD